MQASIGQSKAGHRYVNSDNVKRVTVTGLLVGYVAESFVGESSGALIGDIGVLTAVNVTVGMVPSLALNGCANDSRALYLGSRPPGPVISTARQVDHYMLENRWLGDGLLLVGCQRIVLVIRYQSGEGSGQFCNRSR